MAKTAILEIEATVTERGQTTVPAAIRKALALKKQDRIVFRSMPDGSVTIARRGDAAEEDPALRRFLTLLARDVSDRPRAIRAVPRKFLEDYEALGGTGVDLDAPLSDDA